MRTRAAVALQAGKPLEVMEVNLEGPKAGEVLVEIKATGICHTDEFTLSGADPEGMFPAILGHEGAGVVREVGTGVTSSSDPGRPPISDNGKAGIARVPTATAVAPPGTRFCPAILNVAPSSGRSRRPMKGVPIECAVGDP